MEKNVITDSDYKKGTGTSRATTYTTHNHSIQQKLEKKELPVPPYKCKVPLSLTLVLTLITIWQRTYTEGNTFT